MEYIRLFWEGAPEGEPPVILYEVGTKHERLAFCFVDIFTGDRTHNTPDLYNGAIEIVPTSTVEEFNAHVQDEEFHAHLIEETKFEAVWESHTHNGALEQSGEI